MNTMAFKWIKFRRKGVISEQAAGQEISITCTSYLEIHVVDTHSIQTELIFEGS